MTDWSRGSWCEVWMGGKRSGCLRRLSTFVCLQVLSPFPVGDIREDGEKVNAVSLLFYTAAGNYISPDMIVACSSSIIAA